jgi:hypothetical protein
VLSPAPIYMSSDANLALFENGVLLNTDTFTTSFPAAEPYQRGGSPTCLDAANKRAFFLTTYGEASAYDTASGKAVGKIRLPTGSGATNQFLRWGRDGIAVAYVSGIQLARWSAIVPTKASGLAMAAQAIQPSVAAQFFGETSASAQGSALRVTAVGPQGFTLEYPRRVGLPAGCYSYEMSSDLQHWVPASVQDEKMLGSTFENGVRIDKIQAHISCPMGRCGFVRLKISLP